MDNFHTKLSTLRLVSGLFVVGIIALSLRVFLFSPESIPAGDSVWQLTMSVSVSAGNDHPTIYMAVPLDSENNRVISQTFTHPGLDIVRLIQRKNVTAREIIAVAREKGNLMLTGEYKIHVSHARSWQKWFEKKNGLSPEERMQFLQLPTDLQLDDATLEDTLKTLRTTVLDQDLLIEEIFNFVNQQILSDNKAIFESVENTLSQLRANALGKANVMIALCRASNIPARLVTGVVIQEMLNAAEHYWVEVYSNGRWIPYDPLAGFAGDIPPNYLKLKENSIQLAYRKDGTPLDAVIDMEQIPSPAGLLGTGQKRFRDIFDLARLPISTQFLLSSLLLLPFGALITTFFRNIIGVQTYGTFKSSLLALAIIYADWITVTVVVSAVTIIGVSGRALIPEKITRVPRLSIVLTIVAIAMTLSVSMMDYYNLNPSATVVLLPIIVMTSLVDRVYAIADEKGVAVSLYRLVWTCLIAMLCYLVFSIDTLRQLLVQFPELHFFTLALILLCSAYNGKKLTLYTPSWLREPKHQKVSKTSIPDSNPL
jgi:hypothetical protein